MPKKDLKYLDATIERTTVSDDLIATSENTNRSSTDSSGSPSGFRKPRTISRQLMLSFFLLALVPLVILELVSHWQINNKIEREIKNELRITNALNKTIIVDWFDRVHRQLASIADLPQTVEALRVHRAVYLAELASGPEEASEAEAVANGDRFLVEQVKHFAYLDDIYLLNTQGRVLFAAGDQSLVGSSIVTAESSLSALSILLNKALMTPGIHLHLGDALHQGERPAFMSAPVHDERGHTLGVIILHLNLAALYDAIEHSDIEDYRSYLYPVGEEDKIDLDPRGGISQETADERWRIGAWLAGMDNLLEKKDLLNQERQDTKVDALELLDYPSQNGNSFAVMQLTVDVHGTKWRLVSSLDQNKRRNSAHSLDHFGLVLALITGALVLLVARRVAGRIVRPLENLSELSIRIAQGEKNLMATASNCHEVDTLARSINQMLNAKQLHQEALEASNRASEEAIQSLNELKFALDQHSIVAVTDLQGTITYVNAKFEEISGYDADELLGQNHRILNSGTHDEEFWRNMFLTVSQGKPWRAEVCNRAKNGSLYWVDTTIVAFMRQGKPKNYIAIRTDITMGKLAEQQLIEAKDSAEAGARAKSEFLASMSHEIRTPMNGVLGMLNLLKRTQLNQEQRRQADLAYSSAESLLTIINDILDFSKIEAGKLDLEEMDFDLVAEISEFADTIAPRIQEKGLEFVLDLSGIDRNWVRGDPGRLRQVLINLVGNAVKFTSQGEIVLKAQLLQSYRGRLKLECSVRDTGIGIASDKLDALFESFSQVDASTTRKYGGTGLGLTIVKQLCELMEGTVWVSSEKGQGSEFSFSIFLSASEHEQENYLPSLPAHLNVLFADHNATRRSAIRTQCSGWDVEISEARFQQDVFSVLENSLAAHQPIDVLVCDWMLPDSRQEEITHEQAVAATESFLQELRSQERFGNLKIALMVPLNAGAEIEHFRAMGIDAILRKPLKPLELHQILFGLAKGEREADFISETGHDHKTESMGGELNRIAASVRILLVEDNPVNQLVASSLLQQLGLSCDQAGNGLEAIAALEQSPEDMPYHLILMDCQMPEMDGYEASQQIRAGAAGERYRDITIVAMTANAMKGDRERCLEAGMNDYVSKPVQGEVLKETLEKYLLNDSIAVLDELQTNGDKETPVNVLPSNVPSEKTIDQSAAETDEANPVWDRITALQNLGGNEELYEQLSEAALEDIPVNMQRLENAIGESDFAAAKIAAHSIKGVASSLGGMQLMSQALVSETAAREENLETLKKEFPVLQQRFEALREVMQSE